MTAKGPERASPAPRARWRATTLAAFLVPCVVLLLQTTWFQRNKSITYDETFYLSAALQSVHDGRLDERLAEKGVAPLPVLLAHLPAAWLAGGEARPTPRKGELRDPELVGQARRIHAVIVGCGLLLVVFAWLTARRGTAAGLFGAVLLALSPSIVSHSALATTDACAALFALLALAALDRFDRRPGALWLGGVAAALALAISAKYSGLFLLPVAALWLLRPQLRTLAAKHAAALAHAGVRWSGNLLLLVALVALFTWGLHGLARVEATPEDASQSLWPSPAVGVRAQMNHQAHGHRMFLAGRHSTTGFVEYFPIAFGVKSTPAELLLVLAALGVALAARRWRLPESGPPSATRSLWLLAGGLYALLALGSRVQLGHRYILLLYPLLILWSVDVLAATRARWPTVAPWCAGALLALQVGSAAAIGPHHLAYFNTFSGGPERAWRLLVQSNLDWGQDLLLLRQELDRLGSRRVLLDYWGTADPAAYGLRYVAAEGADADAVASCDHLAVSVTQLQEVLATHPRYAQLRALEPVGRAGYSILIYDMEAVRGSTPPAELDGRER